jgi:hypothetical protein
MCVVIAWSLGGGLGGTSAWAPEASVASPEEDATHFETTSTPVAAPFHLALHDVTSNGDPHGMPVGRAVLVGIDGRVVWELENVGSISASADGTTVALLTGHYQVLVSRLPARPTEIADGPYLTPELSRDGTRLVAQRLGDGGDLFERIANAHGIALVDLSTGEDRLLVTGNDVYAPSFAADDMVFFGSGGPEHFASLYLVDVTNATVAKVTNREPGAREIFPSERPVLANGEVVFLSDGVVSRVRAPIAAEFVSIPRFDLSITDVAEIGAAR